MAAQTARQQGAQLPQDPPCFTGRQAELAQLRDEVVRPALGDAAGPSRVLLVAGRPGSGRTALAVRFARGIAPEYPDGCFFVRMAEAEGAPVPAHRAARQLLAALGLPSATRPLRAGPDAPQQPDRHPDQRSGPARPGVDPAAGSAINPAVGRTDGSPGSPAVASAASGRPGMDPATHPAAGRGDGSPGSPAVASTASGRPGVDPAADPRADPAADPDCVALRAALVSRRVLLVLDDVSSADQVRALLPEAPGCLLVAVTAGPLTGLADARPCVIGGLDLAAATSLLAGLAGDTRIVCDPVAARALAEALACQPTALRLIGGWMRARPRASVTDGLRVIAQTVPAVTTVPQVRLSKRPGAAEPGGPEPLRRAFDVVHGGLPAQAARLLRLLLLAPGGVTEPRTASALLGCPVDAAAVHLATLAEQQLLADEPGGRYRLPGCLRPPLAELLAADRPGETELARARLLERLTRLLTACVQLLAPGAPAPEPLPGPLRFGTAAEAWQWLDQELPVLRAAARVAVGDGRLDGLAMRLVTTLVRALPLWAGRADAVAVELFEGHSLILELSLRAGKPRQQAAALVNLGDLHAAAAEHERALARYRSALGPARAADDQIAVGRILEAVAGAYRASGDLVRATDWYGRALALRRKRGEQRDELRLLGRLASARTAQGKLNDALRDYRAAVALHRRLGDEGGAVGAALGAARVLELGGRAEQALQTQREALGWARQAGGRWPELVLLRMAEVLERAGDPAGARVHREQALLLAQPPVQRRPEAHGPEAHGPEAHGPEARGPGARGPEADGAEAYGGDVKNREERPISPG
ncbi:hypothetical protein [Streptacidiphilus sp. EB129]|uniref:hypothetical protein n=1 Tax=Streptacidiphilus sp. EB129 TaxID=3156262 RepID=UPI003511528A